MSAPVTPLHRLRPQAAALLQRIVTANTLAPVLDAPYLVKGVLDRGAVSVVYGAPGTGKTFWAVDLAHRVDRGERWNGRRTEEGAALYVSLEGGSGRFNNRLHARHASFYVLRGALHLGGRNSEHVVLCEAVRELAAREGRPLNLIVIDTLARAMGPADENAAADVGALVQAVTALAHDTAAHVMLIHHSGKDASRGMRGHSALLGAVDTSIELEKSDDDGRVTRRATVRKQRDGEEGLVFPFDLQRVEIGTDSDGDAVTTCIVATKEDGKLL